MRNGRVSAVLLALGLVACNAILGIEEPEHRTGDAGSSGGTGGIGAGGTGGSAGGGSGGTTSGGAAGSGGNGAVAGGDSGSDAPLCTETFTTLKADSFIIACGSISYGAGAYGTIDTGRAILKFGVGAADAAALQGGTAQGMKLTLARSLDCEGDCPGGLAVSGTFQVFPLRNDWVEKTAATTYSGADHCRRTEGNPGQPWQKDGAEGAADRGGPAGTLTIDAGTNTAVFDLDPLQWKNWVVNNEVSLLVERQGATGTFVYATRESAKYAAPTLVVCK